MNKKKIYISSVCLFFSLCSPAYSYLDPGSISIVLQSILAAIAGIAATYRLWLFKLKNFFSKFKKRKKIENQK